MTKEELEKATGQELIEERNYCGVDGYYGVYLDNVNVEMLKRFNRLAELEQENRLLGERCNQLLKDKGDLTDQIADIKANCDLAIEGRDIKIKELELELTVEKDQHQEEINLHLHAEEYNKELERENAELKENYRKRGDIITSLERQLRLNIHSDQLTKAKEIIREFARLEYADFTNGDYSNELSKVLEQAEQFLREIEK